MWDSLTIQFDGAFIVAEGVLGHAFVCPEVALVHCLYYQPHPHLVRVVCVGGLEVAP